MLEVLSNLICGEEPSQPEETTDLSEIDLFRDGRETPFKTSMATRTRKGEVKEEEFFIMKDARKDITAGKQCPEKSRWSKNSKALFISLSLTILIRSDCPGFFLKWSGASMEYLPKLVLICAAALSSDERLA